MGGRPFRQIMGFNADEPGRCLGDAAASKIPGVLSPPCGHLS
jgi:hypothetical protein